jgi:hypothetical protein
MSRKSITLALAAVVSLGAIALSSSTASAGHPGGGGGYHFGNRSGPVSKVPLITGIKVKPNFPIITGIKKPGPFVAGIVIKPNHPHHAHWPRWYWWRYTTWGRPYLAAPLVAGGVATYAATTPTTNRCTCLTKEYTPQGAVLFKDVCTNEMAMNPPVNASPAADTGPQMPQQPMQQGYLQPQAQPQVQ